MKKFKALLLSLTLGLTAIGCAMPASDVKAETSIPETSTGVTMYRLYNSNSGEHFYTSNATEKDNLVTAGWSDEGIGWIAPETSNTPVYRLYNSNSGDHHYTTSSVEREACITTGWNDEGIGWYSDDDKTVPLYREYNPNAVTGTHNYTTDKAEHDGLVKAGWKDEGIGWYAISDGKSNPPKDPDNETLEIGDIVILGTYEQDNDLTNGSEPIEWQYIADRDGHKLLLAKYALDSKRYYNIERGEIDVTWETCTLRKWLNEDFYNTAFSATDKEKIVLTHNENPDTWDFYKPLNTETEIRGAEGGDDTDDNVFLLSWVEARDYFGGDISTGEWANYNQSLLCKPTAYANRDELTLGFNDPHFPSDIVGCCNWWLRSPGDNNHSATYVQFTGGLTRSYVGRLGVGIRPVILID